MATISPRVTWHCDPKWWTYIKLYRYLGAIIDNAIYVYSLSLISNAYPYLNKFSQYEFIKTPRSTDVFYIENNLQSDKSLSQPDNV